MLYIGNKGVGKTYLLNQIKSQEDEIADKMGRRQAQRVMDLAALRHANRTTQIKLCSGQRLRGHPGYTPSVSCVKPICRVQQKAAMGWLSASVFGKCRYKGEPKLGALCKGEGNMLPPLDVFFYAQQGIVKTILKGTG